MKSLRVRFGRPLRLALLGGGPDSWIGRTHQTAAELDGYWRIVGGVFSSDPRRSRAAGVALGFDRARCYGTLAELIAAEKGRADGVEAVAIMTPNDTHYALSAEALDAGLDVVSDKPVTHDFREACDLVERVRKSGQLYAITHGYSAYPMTRHARELVHDGVLGAPRLVQVEYVQNGLATRIEDAPRTSRLRWIVDPKRSGLALVMSAIGCHAQHLASFAAGRKVSRVCADVGALLPDRELIDYASALTELEGGVRGTFTATQAAAGAENDIRLRVYGEKGMLDWSHREASYLRLALHGEPVRVIGRGDSFLSPPILAAGRTPRGHPEGLREAFANIYAEVAQERMARTLGETTSTFPYPRIEDGAHTMAFIEACLASQQRGAWVDVAPLPS
jgi:predicted dehydrogenase